MKTLAKIIGGAIAIGLLIAFLLVLLPSIARGISPMTYIKTMDLLIPMSGTADVKEAVAYYAQRTHSYPVSNREAYLPPPNELGSGSLERVQIMPGGVIALFYTSNLLHPEGAIYLIPPRNPEEVLYAFSRWDCVSTDFTELDQASDDCRVVDKKELLTLIP